MAQINLNPTFIGQLQNTNQTTYSAARSATGVAIDGTTSGNVGQLFNGSQYSCNEFFLEFDTSQIPAGSSITNAFLSLYNANTQASGSSDNLYVGAYDWGANFGTGAWVTSFPAELVSHTCNIGSVGSFSFPSSASLISALNLSGKTRLIVFSENQDFNTAPTRVDALTLEWDSSHLPLLAVDYFGPAPTVTAIAPNVSLPAGGGTATITGTGFQNYSPGTNTVTINGTTASGVTVLSDTQLTCTIPAGTAGTGNVTVHNNNGTGTLTNGFTYASVKDTHVYLVKGGTVGGTDHADTVDLWPLSATAKTYGSSTDLWGQSLTPSDVNGSGFGVAIAATVAGGHAAISAAELTVYFSGGASSQPGSYLMTVNVAADGETVTPLVFKLPAAGFSPALDTSLSHAASGVDFYTSRLHLPSRDIEKLYRCLEFWCDLSPNTNVPGLQVWAAIDDGSFFQLLDGTGAPATLTTSGAQRLFFPATSQAVGHYLQLDFKIPSLGGGQVAMSAIIRDAGLRVSLRPVATDVIQATLILGMGEFEDKTSQLDLEADQLATLKAQLQPGAVVAYQDPVTGLTGYALILGLEFQEIFFPGDNAPTLVAHIAMRKTPFS